MGLNSKEEKIYMGEMEFTKTNKGLSETSGDKFYSLLISILQHISQKPWINIRMEELELLNYTHEWELLTEKIVQPYSNLELLSEIRILRTGSQDLSKLVRLLSKYFKLNVQVGIHSGKGFYESGELKPSSELSVNMLENPNCYIPVFESAGNPASMRLGYFRLIAENRLLLPDKMDYANELMDQLNRFDILRNIFQEKYNRGLDDLANTIVQKEAESLRKCLSFAQIFKIIPLPDENDYIRKYLEEIEPELNDKEKVELRTRLISTMTTEMYFPIRREALLEKEKFERRSLEMAERREKLKEQNEKLAESIQNSQAGLAKLEETLKNSYADSVKKENDMEKSQAASKELNEEITRLKNSLREMEETKAFNEFLEELDFLNADLKMLDEFIKLPEKWKTWTLAKIMSCLLKILGINEYPTNLETRITKNTSTDKERVIEAIDQILEMPTIQPGMNGKLIVKGNNIVVANVLPQIQKFLPGEGKHKIHEVQFISRGNLIINSDMRLPGTNLVMIGRNVTVPLEVKMDVTGVSAKDPVELKAKNGDGYGMPGDPGLDGGAGGNGGEVYIEARESFINSNSLHVNCAGGSGARGQDGGDGINGSDGRHGVHATPLPEPSWWDSYKIGGSFKLIARGTRGQPGTSGGIGGRGGFGGEGGFAGKSTLVFPDGKKKENSYQNGQQGKDGIRGRNGVHGKHGKHGQDHGWGKAGFWSKSTETWGFQLTSRVISNWTFNGQEIIKGTEPPYPTVQMNQNQVSQAKENATRKKAEKAECINKSTLSSLRTLIVTRDSSKADMTVEQDIQATKESLVNQMSKSSLGSEKESRAQAELKNHKELIQQQEKQRDEAKNMISKAQNKVAQFQSEITKAEIEEQISKAKMGEFEQIAISLENQYNEALSNIITTQQQSLTQTQVEQNRLRVDPLGGDEYWIPDGISYTKPIENPEFQESAGDDEFEFLSEALKLNEDPEFLVRIEGSVQAVKSELGYVPEHLKEFMRNLKTYTETSATFFGLSTEEYILEKLSSDVTVAERNGKDKHVAELLSHYQLNSAQKAAKSFLDAAMNKFNINSSAQATKLAQQTYDLFNLILNLRQRKFPNFNRGKVPLTSELVKVFDEIEETEIFMQSCDRWIQDEEKLPMPEEKSVRSTNTQQKSGWARLKAKRHLLRKTGLAEIVLQNMKKRMLEKARENYKRIRPVLSVDFKKYLEDFKNCVKNSKSDREFDRNFNNLLGQLDSFSVKNVLSKIKKFFEGSAGSLKLNDLFIILERLDLTISNFNDIQTALAKHGKDSKDKARKDEMSEFEFNLTAIYKEKFRETIMSEINSISDRKGELKDAFLREIDRFEKMIESTHLNMPYNERLKIFESLKKDMQKMDTVLQLNRYVNEQFQKLAKTKENGSEKALASEKILFIAFKDQLNGYLLGMTTRNDVLAPYYGFYIENFESSLDELKSLESIIRMDLTDHNLQVSLKLQKIIDEKVRVKCEEIQRQCIEKFDVKECQRIGTDVTKFLSKFVSGENMEESRVTEITKTRKYFAFSLARIELVLALNGKCNKMNSLHDSLLAIGVDNPEKFIEELDIFYEECISEFKKKTLPKFLDETLEKFDSSKAGEYFLDALHFVKFEIKDVKGLCSTKVTQLLKNIKENSHPKEHQENIKHFEAVFECISRDSDFPMQALLAKLNQAASQAREIKALLKNVSRTFEDLNLKFSTAAYTKFVQQVVEQINLKNIPTLEDLNEKFLRIDLSRSEGNLQQLNAAQIVSIMSIEKFPFKAELDIILTILYGEAVGTDNIRGKVQLEIMHWHLSNENAIPEVALWKIFTMKMKTYVKKKSAKIYLLNQLLNSEYEDPLKQFLNRLLQKLNSFSAQEIAKLKISSLKPDDISTQEKLYSKLFPSFERDKLRNFLLIETEVQLLDLYFKAKSPNLERKFVKILSNQSPDTWAFAFEQVLFLNLCENLTTFIRPSDNPLESKLDILRSIKTFYFLSGESNRLECLDLLIHKFGTAVRANQLKLTQPELLNFFEFAKDLEFLTFAKLMNTRFSKNYMKAILEECIFQDLQKIQKRKSKEVTPGEIPGYYKRTLYNFTREMKPKKLEFIFILHSRLIQVQKMMDADSMIEPSVIVDVIKKFDSLILQLTDSDVQMGTLILKFESTPELSYWPRILRYEEFKTMKMDQKIIDKLFKMDEQFGEGLVDSLSQALVTLSLEPTAALFLVSNFSNGEWIFDQDALKILEKNPTTYKAALESYSEEKRKNELPLRDLISSAKSHRLNSTNVSVLAEVERTILQLYKVLQKPDFQFLSANPDKRQRQLEGWAKALSAKKIKWNDQFPYGFRKTVILDLVGIIYRAAEHHFLIENPNKPISPRNAQLVSLFLLIDGLHTGKGRIGEITTGEGKSLIVSMFAAFCAFLGANVNIITSNKVLAEKDAKEFKPFYKSLGITVSNNCDSACKSDEDRKKRYNHRIIYGEVGGFQADLLNSEFYQKDIARKRVDAVIVDEVDSLLLDKGANMLYLSHDIPELKYLRIIKLVIWEAVQKQECPTPKESPSQYTENDLNSVRKSVEHRLKIDKRLAIPKCLDKFIQDRLGVWVKQAFRARFMPINEDFIVEKDEKVVNMDKDTGVEQANMQFSLGLQQFLQLRFGTKITAESLKCVFMSNLSYFNKYWGKLYGISGTLGDSAELKLLGDKYNVLFFGMPQHKLNKRVEKTPICGQSDEEWLSGIGKAIQDHPNQPILIICENIARLNQIFQYLEEHGEFVEGKFIHPPYKSSESDVEFTETIKKAGGLKGNEIIISTNLAGRGTDFKISDEAKNPGLHVVLTFLPTNMRVEIQACGRTARAGESGTVQFVLKVDEQDVTIETLKEQRRIRELNRIGSIATREIPRIHLEDELFGMYLNFVDKYVRVSRHFEKFPKRVRELQIKFLNNRWAVWLDSIQGFLENLHLQGHKSRDAVMRKYKIFQNEMSTLLYESSYESQLWAIFPSELIKLGILYETIGTKSLYGALSKLEFNEAGDICQESLENVGHFLKQSVKLFTNPSEVFDEIAKYATRPSDLQIGINRLTDADLRDGSFTEGASAFLATMNLQKDAKEKKWVKKHLKNAVQKLERRIIQNSSCSDLLTLANKYRVREKDLFTERPHFKTQLDNEINLFQHHIDSIRNALHFEITLASVKTINGVDSQKEAEEIFAKIIGLREIIQGYRCSRKIDYSKGINESLTQEFIFFEGDVEEIIVSKRSETSRLIHPTDLEPLILTRDEFLNTLMEEGLVEKEALISINSENKETGENEFPTVFTNFKELITSFLKGSLGKIYDEDELFRNPGLAHFGGSRRTEFREFLIKVGWLEEQKGPKLETNLLININRENYEEFRKQAKVKFPSELINFQDTIIIFLNRNSGKVYDENELFKIPDSLSQTKIEESVRTNLKNFLKSVGWLTEGSISAKINKTNKRNKIENKDKCDDQGLIDLIDYKWNEIPQKLKRFDTDKILELLVDKGNCCFKDNIELEELANFPTTKSEGAKLVFDHLISKNIIKKHKVYFPTTDSYDKINIRIKKIKDQLETIRKDLREIFDKHHKDSDEERKAKINKVKDRFQLSYISEKIYDTFLSEENKTAKIASLAKEKVEKDYEEKFENYYSEILNLLLNSVGTLKRYEKIRVNYHNLSTRLSIDNNQYLDELNELAKEGILDRIFTFDEIIRFYHNFAALGILVLGVAELAAGVALEFSSFGTLSLLGAQILVSEGGSDIYYAFKCLWQGKRVDGADYWKYKKTSMAFSVATMGFGGIGGTGIAKVGASFLGAFTTLLLKQMAKAGGRAMLEKFIEDNLKSAVQGNLFNIGQALDAVMVTPEFEKQINKFMERAETLRSVSYEKDQAKDFIEKLVNGLDGKTKNSSLALALDTMWSSIWFRLYTDIAKQVFKWIMPIQLKGMQGLYGNSERGLMNSQEALKDFSVTVMKSLNKAIKEKTGRVAKERNEYLHKDEKPTKEEFENFTKSQYTKIKCDLREMIADKIFVNLCSPAVHERIKISVISSYGKCTYAATLDGTVVLIEDSGKRKEVEEDSDSSSESREKLKFVSNADDRTVGEVEKLLGPDSVEFFRDNFGNVFVNLKPKDAPMLSTKSTAVDEYLSFKNRFSSGKATQNL